MSKQQEIFNFLKKKTDFTKKAKITKEKAKKIFIAFSIMLVLDVLILPIISSVIDGSYECNDRTFTCVILSCIPLILFGIFWCLVWFGVYEAFFITDSKWEKMKNSSFFLIRLKIKNSDYISSLHGKDFEKKQSVVMLVIFCFAIGYFFLLESYQIIRILIK